MKNKIKELFQKIKAPKVEVIPIPIYQAVVAGFSLLALGSIVALVKRVRK
jgi:hypothetical protein